MISTHGGGITVTRGASGTINFSISFTGILSSVLANADEIFIQALTAEEREKYTRMKCEYRGGFDIPFLSMLGANIGTEVNVGHMTSVRNGDMRYDVKASAAREVLRNVCGRRYRIVGRKTVSGKSFVPKTYFVYIKAARVRGPEGDFVVVSGRAEDVVVATQTGQVFEFGAEEYRVDEE